jgi:two-component system response regulator QseB
MEHYSILLVEDDPALGPLTAYALSDFGHRVVLVTSVPAAFTRLFAANDFDAVLLDLELGTERGETLIEQLRIAHCDVPEVIIVSAQPPVELQRAMRRIDACAALGKPCSVRELNAELERCLDERARGDR